MAIDTTAIQQQYKITEVLERYGHKPKIGRMKYCCPLHQDSDPSFSVKTMSDGSQRFKCHSASCGKHGDVLQLVMELEGCTMPKAVEILTGSAPVTGKPPVNGTKPKAVLPQLNLTWGTVPKRREPHWQVGQPLTLRTANQKTVTYRPSLIHIYRDRSQAVVAATVRVEVRKGEEVGKAVYPLRYAVEEGEWYLKGFTNEEPTPLYGANRLDGNDLPVLVVEGEKVVDNLQPLLEGQYVVVSWLGGTGQVEYADWKELQGRDVTLWPDFDWLKPNQTARTGQVAAEKAAAKIEEVGVRRLRLIDITDFGEGQYRDGWDAADACDPTDPNALGKVLVPWIERRAKPWGKSGQWLPDGIKPVMSGSGENRSVKKDDPTNLWLLLLHNPQFKGRFTYDVFDQVVLVDNKPMNGSALRDLRLEITQSKWPLQPKIKDLQDSVVALALENRTNLFARSLMALQWDGKPRLKAESMVLTTGSKGLLVDYANCEDTPFNRTIGMRWMVGVAQRLMQNPNSQTGWQHDSILVLEGEQGLRKTSFLRVLGSVLGREAYTELQGSLGRDKDDLMKLRGKCIVELAEMTAHRKSDQDAFKAFIDKKVDEYRPPYGSEIIKQPRMVVFAGTTNRDTYLNDPTGARRFWPARVEAEIDTHKLKQDLEQIWAEAVHLARNGEPNHLVDDEIEWHEDAVAHRNQLEAWESMFDRQAPTNVEGFTLEQAFSFVGIMSASDMTQGATRRLEDMLTRKGYKYRQGSPTSPGQTRKWLWRLTSSRTKKTKLLPRS